MYSKLSITLYFSLVIILNSCAVPKMNELPATDIMPIHQNPRVGDYALYSANSGEVTKRFEVAEVRGEEIIIRYKVVHPDQSVDEIQWFYRKLDKEGKVLEAWMIEGGKRFETPIAKAGAESSLEHFKNLELPGKKTITTKAGTFDIDQAFNYIYRLDLGVMKSRSTHFDMMSPKVPFRLVRSEIVATSEIGPYIRTLKFLTAAGEAILTKDYFDIYEDMNPEMDPHHVVNELVEYGFGKK